MKTLPKLAWGLLILIAAIVVLFTISPAGGKLLAVYPNTARALYAAAVLCLTAWAGRIWMPLRKPQLDMQILAAIAAFAVIGALSVRPDNGGPVRPVVVGAGGLALLLGLTRRVHVGEVSHITGRPGTDRTVWISPLPNRQFKNRKGEERWGWVPTPAPTRMRIMETKRTPPRRDDRLFPLAEEARFQLVVRGDADDVNGLRDRALIVIVTGILGNSLYVVGRPGSGGARGSPAPQTSGCWW
jgi:hypothetical protein